MASEDRHILRDNFIAALRIYIRRVAIDDHSVEDHMNITYAESDLKTELDRLLDFEPSPFKND